jgi:hypothetical protein
MVIALLAPEVFHGLSNATGPCVLVHVEPEDTLPIGRTSVLLRPGGLTVTAVTGPSGAEDWRSCPATPLEICDHDRASRVRKAEMWERLGLPPELAPLMILLAGDGGSVRVYHRIESGRGGVLFTALGDVPVEGASADALFGAVNQARELFRRTQGAFNPGRNHTRWKAGLELERKFTIAIQYGDGPAPLDTWSLHRSLHREIRTRRWPGFMPEFNEEFHVWDYGSEMFEVTSPPSANGYIAFIPQADGKVTVKYKRFLKDCELRQEDISNNITLTADHFEHAARSISGGAVAPLPGFRRKRFDCDVESLETGNVYGIFFDICRTTSGAPALLSQCEVEYLRTRSLAPITGVEAEFETVCGLMRSFLGRHGVSHVEGHYSKLSFTRDVAQGRLAQGGAG